MAHEKYQEPECCWSDPDLAICNEHSIPNQIDSDAQMLKYFQRAVSATYPADWRNRTPLFLVVRGK